MTCGWICGNSNRHLKTGVTFELCFQFPLRTTNIFRQFIDRRRYHLYMVHAWGLALSLTTVVIIFDYIKPFRNDLLPGVGMDTCFLQSMNSCINYSVSRLQLNIWIFELQWNHHYCICMCRFSSYSRLISCTSFRSHWKFVEFNVKSPKWRQKWNVCDFKAIWIMEQTSKSK